MRGKKIGIIIIIIFLIVAIVAGVFAYLFLATDIFKGNKKLFFNYISETVENVEKIADSKILENYKNKINDQNCETNTSVNFKYSEGGEISSGYNNLNINMKTQKEDKYNYKNAQILFSDRSIVQVEGIQSENLYGIRFTNIFNQFVTLNEGKNINGLDLTDDNLAIMKSIIEDDKEFYDGILFTEQDYQELKQKYMQIIVSALADGTFSKKSDSLITVNSQTLKTTAYSCELNNLQVQNLVIKLLSELENDEIILSKVGNLMNDTKKYENYFNNLLRQAEDTEFSNLKVTIYKQNKSIVRTSINLGTDSIIIETSNSDGKDILKIQHETLNSEKEINQQLVLNKQTTDAKETYTLNLEIVNGDDKYSVEATLESDYKTTDLNLDFYKGIVNINVIAKNTITDNVEQKMELGSSNNVVLNNLSSELLGKVVDKMKTAYTDTLLKRYNLLVKKLKSEDLMSALKGIISEGNFDDDTSSDQPETPADNQVTKEEINRFNAKFEFYNGTDIPADSVKDLIQIASNNLESVDITPLQSESTSSSEKIKESIKLNIKKDTQNTDLANAILEKISSEEKYNITIGYNKSTGIIETITIVPSNK